MLRPTRSRLVTEIDIVPAFRWCNLIKEKSFSVQNMGISGFARPEAAGGWLTLRPSPRLRRRPAFLGNVAGDWRCFSRTAKPGRRLRRKQAPFGHLPGGLRVRGQGQPRCFAAP